MARKKNFDETEVLDKALDIFWAKGYNATSIQDLVDGLGINRASIYDTWGDKHKLYLQSMERYRQHASSWLLNEIRSDKSALEIIRSFVEYNIQQAISDEQQKGCFIMNSTSELANCDNEVNTIVTQHRHKTEAVLTQIIQEGQEAGEISTKHSSETLAQFIFSTIGGLRVVSKGAFSKKELEQIMEVALSALH